MPTPTSADGGTADSERPNTSTTQSSPHCSWAGSSSKPLSHIAAIDRGEIVIAQRISTRPAGGQPALEPRLLLAHRLPSRNRCWPRVLPTGPEYAAGLDPRHAQRRLVVLGAPQALVGGNGEA